MKKIVDIRDIDLTAIKDDKLKAILICIYTNAKVDEVELPFAGSPNGGWWGDAFEIKVAGRKIKYTLGSKLWTLMTGKLNDEIAEEVRGYVKTSLSVLVSAKVISAPTVVVERIDNRVNLLLIFENETISLEGWE
ncbi:MAG: phage GP46 family protein [Alphaproteobacteria bacterium]